MTFLYIGVVVVLGAMQRSLIFPGAATQGKPWAAVLPPRGAEVVRLTAHDGTRIVALFGPALQEDGRARDDASRRPSLIYFYGNAMCVADAVDQFQQLRRLGVNVLVPDYAGYGQSGGTASEAGCSATAEAAYDYLKNRSDLDPSRIVVGGWSLGAAVAVDLASRRPVAGLATFSAFTSMVDLGRQLYPILPVSLVLRHRFDSLSKAGRVSCPAFVSHGLDDSLIPAAMSGRLALALAGPVTRIEVDKADHNDLFVVGAGTIYPALRHFFESLSQSGM